MIRTFASTATALAGTYLAAAVGGYVFARLGVPLPWMVGSIVVTAVVTVAGAPTRALAAARPGGQIIIGSAVGASFTPQVIGVIATLSIPIVLIALFTLVFALAVAALMMRLSRIDAVTSCIACIPVGPVEAANLAVRFGIDTGSIAFVQTLRMVSIVCIVPPVMFWLSTAQFTDIPAPASVSYLGGALLALGCVATVWLFGLVRLPNRAFLGAVTFAVCATIFEAPVDPLPGFVLKAGQVMLGVAIGLMFERAMFLTRRRFMVAGLLCAWLLILMCTAMGAVIAYLVTGRVDTFVLASIPGTLAEMALTAQLLDADVVVVTTFHVIRIYILLFASPLVIAALRFLGERRARA